MLVICIFIFIPEDGGSMFLPYAIYLAENQQVDIFKW